jgi:hypothetical protein
MHNPLSTHAAICRFLTERYAEERANAQWGAEMLLKAGAPQIGLSIAEAERRGRVDVERVELKVRFLEETVRPYLGAAGVIGENADRQVRLLAWAYSNHRDYKDRWLPPEQ